VVRTMLAPRFLPGATALDGTTQHSAELRR
jgi:hypothetical protein